MAQNRGSGTSHRSTTPSVTSQGAYAPAVSIRGNRERQHMTHHPGHTSGPREPLALRGHPPHRGTLVDPEAVQQVPVQCGAREDGGRKGRSSRFSVTMTAEPQSRDPPGTCVTTTAVELMG